METPAAPAHDHASRLSRAGAKLLDQLACAAPDTIVAKARH